MDAIPGLDDQAKNMRVKQISKRFDIVMDDASMIYKDTNPDKIKRLQIALDWFEEGDFEKSKASLKLEQLLVQMV